MLRNGLAVVSFAALEDFIRARTGEALSAVAAAGIAFSQLPRTLQQAATEGALRAALAQMSFMEDRATRGPPFLQVTAAHVASTGGYPYSLSSYSLGHQGSNLSFDDVPKVLKAFKVDAPWRELTALAARAGFAALPLHDFYSETLRRRHRAAHEGSTDTPLADIAAFAAGARACALAFELLLSQAVARLTAGRAGPTRGSDVAIVFLDSTAHTKRLVDEGGTTLHETPRTERLGAFLEASMAIGAALVARDALGLPYAWYPSSA
jgi:hypothetical protein